MAPFIGGLKRAVFTLILALGIATLIPFRSVPIFCSYPSLEGKVYVVTGASSGIGRGLAIHFARRGASLILVARRQQDLSETVKLCGNRTRIVPLAADVAEPWVTDKLQEIIQKEFSGRLDVLVLNHAVQPTFLMAELPPAEYEKEIRKVLDVNYFSNLRLTAKLREGLERTNGRVVGMGSGGQFLPPLFMSSYGMSKCALDAFFDHLYLEQRLLNRKLRPQYIIIGEILTEKLMEISQQKSERATSVDAGVEQLACVMERDTPRAYVPFNMVAPLQAWGRTVQFFWPSMNMLGWVGPNKDFVSRMNAASV